MTCPFFFSLHNILQSPAIPPLPEGRGSSESQNLEERMEQSLEKRALFFGWGEFKPQHLLPRAHSSESRQEEQESPFLIFAVPLKFEHSRDLMK